MNSFSVLLTCRAIKCGNFFCWIWEALFSDERREFSCHPHLLGDINVISNLLHKHSMIILSLPPFFYWSSTSKFLNNFKNCMPGQLLKSDNWPIFLTAIILENYDIRFLDSFWRNPNFKILDNFFQSNSWIIPWISSQFQDQSNSSDLNPG